VYKKLFVNSAFNFFFNFTLQVYIDKFYTNRCCCRCWPYTEKLRKFHNVFSQIHMSFQW